ncbi:AAA family ATPase [Brachybacterium sp. Z12]|uniref:AAA family ATPase n=1 Tax=Brachybacterium sp. Z12 TaxID=2759167 RepID=UPI001862BE74|nr:ATP-binding protein [Brachybacterium sp. Z12]QNN83229.1 AAA family ATPase [Brachybacterium sp. Z12]
MSQRAPILILLGGAPGSGKSTLAALLAAERPLALALDIDVIKHALGGWDEELTRSGLQARRLATAMIGQHLADGHDVVLGQYFARTPFLEELEQLAAEHGAGFVEAVLILDEQTLAQRLQGRRDRPDRPEQARNDRFVGPDDAGELVRSIEDVLALRPTARRVDASGNIAETLASLRALQGP